MYSIARCLSKHAIGKLSLVLHTFEKCFEKCFEKFAGHARYSFYIFMEVDGSEHFSGHYEDLCDPILVLHACSYAPRNIRRRGAQPQYSKWQRTCPLGAENACR
jgi:hypothetical protein